MRTHHVRARDDQTFDHRRDEHAIALTLAQRVEQFDHRGALAPLGKNRASARVGAGFEDPIEQHRGQGQVFVHRDARDVQRRRDDGVIGHADRVHIRAGVEKFHRRRQRLGDLRLLRVHAES